MFEKLSLFSKTGHALDPPYQIILKKVVENVYLYFYLGIINKESKKHIWILSRN